jgi:DNA modification methylase
MKCINQAGGDNWTMFNGDCVEIMKGIPDNSVGLSIDSPPFVGLYIYSDSDRDMGNCGSWDEFFQHYRYAIKENYRITMPGRLSVIHCKDLPAYFHRDGYAGLKDFPGEIIKAHEAEGWCYHSRVTIWKCPVVERERTNNNGLLHKTVLRDRSQLRQGMADYLIIMRKVPASTLESLEPVGRGEGFKKYIGIDECDPRKEGSFHPSPFARKRVASDDSINVWRRYAEPVWWDINQQNVLNSKIARDEKDEKHICPLQLDVIARAIQIWSNPGDVVFSKFAGVGSEGYEAVKAGRKFIGAELKPAYFRQAVKACRSAASRTDQDDMPLITQATETTSDETSETEE